MCTFPPWLEELQHRDTFRARLNRGMPARVVVRNADAEATGWLRDLSLHGCLVELESAAAGMLDGHGQLLCLELLFPDRSRFVLTARPCHREIRGRYIRCGFSIIAQSRQQQRQLWFLVREIEREAARNAAAGRGDLRSSRLFTGSAVTYRGDPGAR